MDDSGDGLLSEEEMSEWLMDERSLESDRGIRAQVALMVDHSIVIYFKYIYIYIYI